MPVGPFESWSASDRLAWLAEEMTVVANSGTEVSLLALGEWASQIQAIADEMASASLTATPTVALCAVKPTVRRQVQCDRPAGHQGDHSWEADRQRQLRREYEAEAARVPDLTRRLAAMTERARKLGRDRDHLKVLAESRGWAASRGRRRQRRASRG